jgi:AcrR family transcriptional regulator
MTGKRAAMRAETTAAIIRKARQQIDTKGAPNISLREIARDLDMPSSAIYRYFESRDQLLTVLIIDGFNRLGAVVEAADAQHRRDEFVGRWNSIAHAMRSWALENPSDYGLMFGTPVPGYVAPEDTVAPAMRYVNVLRRLLEDAHLGGCEPLVDSIKTKGIVGEYRTVRRSMNVNVSDEMLLAGLAVWATLIGAISLEIFDHVDTVFTKPEVHFTALVDMLGRQMMGLV